MFKACGKIFGFVSSMPLESEHDQIFEAYEPFLEERCGFLGKYNQMDFLGKGVLSKFVELFLVLAK